MKHLSAQAFRYAVPAFGILFLFSLAPPLHGQDAAGLYKAKCAACHGADGKGNSPMAKKLGVRDLASPDVQKQTDDELFAIIQKGKNKMPAYASSLKDAQIKDLVAYIRELAKKK
jgi:mono/diheme cytochrome c family protein